MKLNLGSGLDYQKGWTNVDNNPQAYHTDMVFDLNQVPYPIKESSVEEIQMKMILEHLDNPNILKELVRICKHGAKITIIVPHADSYAYKTDIQHRVGFTEYSFEPELLKEYGVSNNLFLTSFRFIWKNKWKAYLPMWLKKSLNNMFDDMEFVFHVAKPLEGMK